jgi:dipeptidyl aminopeptidase/acylaminoacyl peptidase
MYLTEAIRNLGRAATLTLTVLTPGLAVQAHPPSFTLEQIMSAPFPSGLVTTPVGHSVAWVFDIQGCRNVWFADGTGAIKAHPLTQFTGDEGLDIAQLAWSPDAKWISFTRAGDLEEEVPANINNSPAGPVPQEVWIVPTGGGDAHKIADGHHPVFSPDGTQLLFIDKGRILTASVTGDPSPKTLIVDLGKLSDVTWSPDGQRFAFVSNRPDHSIVGIYDVQRRSIAWESPSLDHDTSPVFSPDGAHVAFIREPAEKVPVFLSRRSGQPWSIWVADITTGQGRPIWVSDPGAGSVFHPTLSGTNLLWTSQQQLVFPWEKTGWLQLYAVPARGGQSRALTSGSFEVMHMELSHDRRRLVFSSTQGETDRMHVWAVEVDRGTPTRLGAGATIEDYPQPSADGSLVYALQSDATHSLQPVVSRSGQWQKLAPQTVPANFPVAQLVTPQAVTFAAKDGQQVHGQLFLPNTGLPTTGTAAKSRPAILFFHGGPRRQMLLGFHPMDAYNWMYCENQYFASEGYVVLSVNYRGGIGYGLDYREADNFGPGGGSELNDLLGAISYLQSRPDVDRSRLGIWGGSYGGLMTALGLARASDSLAAGVDYAGVHNWASFLASVGVPAEPGDAAKKAFDSSPLATIDRWSSPVLIVQADDDRSVPASQASELIAALRQRHVEHDTLIIPNEIHDLILHSSWMTLFTAADDYFARKLDHRTVATPAANTAR